MLTTAPSTGRPWVSTRRIARRVGSTACRCSSSRRSSISGWPETLKRSAKNAAALRTSGSLSEKTEVNEVRSRDFSSAAMSGSTERSPMTSTARLPLGRVAVLQRGDPFLDRFPLDHAGVIVGLRSRRLSRGAGEMARPIDHPAGTIHRKMIRASRPRGRFIAYSPGWMMRPHPPSFSSPARPKVSPIRVRDHRPGGLMSRNSRPPRYRAATFVAP